MNKKTLVIAIAVTVIISGAAGLFFLKRSNTSYEYATVKRGDLLQEVSASGKVESSSKIDLHFKNSGKLVEMNAKVGRKVSFGQLLARQDTAQLDAQVSEMQAGIDLQNAKLQQLISGASSEDISVYETAIVNAEQSLEDSEKNIIDKIKNAYTKSDDAIRGKSDQLFNNPKNYNTQLIFTTSDSRLESDVESQRFLIEGALNNWSNSLKVISTQSNLSSDIELANKNINQIKVFLDDLSSIVNALTVYANIPQATIDKWKTDISTARTNVDFAGSNLSLAEENFKAKEGILRTAQNQLALKKAGLRASDIAVYQAQINQAEASLQKTQAQKKELLIFAPASGVITYTNGEVGENITPEMNLISLESLGALQVKLNVVEDKIINVKIGQEVKITFDAIENEKFTGKVVFIDPAETVVGGVVYYQTTILFDKTDERVRPGMTANIWIKTAVSKGALFVPVSVIRKKENTKIVQVLEGDKVIEKEVVTGIKNDKGMIEIISGISEGEQVILTNKK